MIEETLEEYMKKITIINDKVAEYRNEDKGLIYPLNLTQLLTRVDYLELGKEELQKAKFEQKVDNKDYQMYDCEKVVPKSDITKKKEDMFTLTKKTYKGTHIWNVSNAVGIHTTFESKEDALKLNNDINSLIYKELNK